MPAVKRDNKLILSRLKRLFQHYFRIDCRFRRGPAWFTKTNVASECLIDPNNSRFFFVKGERDYDVCDGWSVLIQRRRYL